MIPLRFVALALGAALGVFYPFVSVILADRGFGAASIGFITAVAAAGFTVAVPAWGHLADVRLGRPRTLQLCSIGAAAAVATLIAPLPAILVGIALVAFWVFASAWQPLADAIAVNAVRDQRRDYARIRVLTSVSFAIGSVAAGFVYDQTGYGSAFAIFAVLALSMAAAAWWLPDVDRVDLASHRHDSRPERPRVRRPTWRFGSTGVALAIAPRLGLVMLAVALVHFGIISGFTFLGLRIVELGGNPSDVALSAGISATAEIPAMLLAAAVATRIGLRGMFAGSALIYAACLTAWAVIDTPALIIATRAITGIAFAGLVVSVVLTIATLLPAALQATGQALYQTIAFGAASVVANVVGGFVYGSVGHWALFGLGAVLAIGAAVVGWFAVPPRLTEPPADPVTAPTGSEVAAAR